MTLDQSVKIRVCQIKFPMELAWQKLTKFSTFKLWLKVFVALKLKSLFHRKPLLPVPILRHWVTTPELQKFTTQLAPMRVFKKLASGDRAFVLLPAIGDCASLCQSYTDCSYLTFVPGFLLSACYLYGGTTLTAEYCHSGAWAASKKC
jgi:hypothetical protein